jgi:O-antigen/teichoic acid export membrane protein
MNYAKKVVSNYLFVLAIKVVGVVSVLFANAFLARMLTQNELGVYFLLVSTTAFFSMFVRAGQRQAIVRLVSEAISHNLLPNVLSITLSGLIIIIGCSIIFLITWLIGLDVFLAGIFNTSSFEIFSGLVFVWIIVLALETPVIETLRGLHKVGSASVFEKFLSQIFLLVIIYICYKYGVPLTLKDVIEVTIVCLFASVLIGTVVLHFNLRGYGCSYEISVNDILKISMPLLFVNVTNFMLNNSGIWLSSMILTQKDVALYGAAWKFVNVVVFPLTIANLALQPIIVQLHSTNKLEKLEKILRGSAAMLALPAIAITIIMIYYRNELLTLVYGKEFVESANVFTVLTIGQLLNVLTGQSLLFLGLCGYQRLLMKISFICFVISIFSSIFLAKNYGVIGIATGVTIGLVMINIIAVVFIRYSVGIKIYASFKPEFIKDAIRRVIS